MLRNYLVTALRNLKRNRVYTFLNIFGLALGIGCALVIYKVIRFEYSFDKHQEHYESIYRVVNNNIFPDRTDKGMGTPHPVGPAIKADFPGIQKITRINYMNEAQLNTYGPGEQYNKFLVEGVAFADSTFFEIFTVKWLAGNQATALTQPHTVVISRSEAHKLFHLTDGQENLALDKLINYGNESDFRVVGVMDDPVETTTFPFTYLFDYNSQGGEINPYFHDGNNWNSTSSNTNTYFIPGPGFSIPEFNEQMLDFVEKYRGEGESDRTRYLAQPLSEIHFSKEYEAYVPTASKNLLLALGLIGIFLVVTACINFINLATAQAANRAKEIGIRKAIGSVSSDLVIQFLSEIAMITFFALLLALGISEIMFNLLEDIIGYQLSIDLLHSPETLIFLLVLFVMVTLLSGFYPSVLLSRMKTVDALKRKFNANKHSGGLSLRKSLVGLQFGISQFLIIGTLIVSSQTDFFLSKDPGFDSDAILTSYLPERDPVKLERFRQLLTASPSITNVSYSLSEPTGNSNSMSGFNYAPMQSEKSYHGNFKVVDENYTDLFGLKLLAGRAIQKGDSQNIVINRKVADLIGFKDRYNEVVGESLKTGWNGDKKIVGVIDNFHTYNLEEDLEYVIMIYMPKIFYTVSFKTPSLATVQEAKGVFENAWNTVFPKYVLDYDFYDQQLKENYKDVMKVTSLMKHFAAIAILIGCLGLYGLIAFIAMNKTKEIGVRKVLGASIFNILSIFSKEVIILMSISFVVIAPLAFYLMSQWLDSFAYSIDLGAGFFVVAFLVTLLIAVVTISHKTITTALINPATTLHDD